MQEIEDNNGISKKKYKMAIKTDVIINIGGKSKFNHFGLYGLSKSMREGGYTTYIYGLKGIVNFIIDKRWGWYSQGKKRF